MPGVCFAASPGAPACLGWPDVCAGACWHHRDLPMGSSTSTAGRMHCALFGTAGGTRLPPQSPAPWDAVQSISAGSRAGTAQLRVSPLLHHTHPSFHLLPNSLSGRAHQREPGQGFTHRTPATTASSLPTALPRRPRPPLDHPSPFADVVAEVEASTAKV